MTSSLCVAKKELRTAGKKAERIFEKKKEKNVVYLDIEPLTVSALTATVGDVILRQTESCADEILHLQLHLLGSCCHVVVGRLLIVVVVGVITDQFTVTHREEAGTDIEYR